MSTIRPLVAVLLAASVLAAAPAAGVTMFSQSNLVVSKLTYAGNSSTISVGQALPGGGKAIADGSFPGVFANNTVDSSFGITAPYSLDSFTLSHSNTVATKVGTLAIPSASFTGSFSSKSEGAINRSTDGSYLTLEGYAAGINVLDASNANTPGANDPTNPVQLTYQRSVARIDTAGNVVTTANNSYSGNNPRAVILADGQYYAAGNAGNGSNPQPGNLTATTGVQLIDPVTGANTRIGDFNVTQYGYPADKQPKDNNFRGETIFDNTLYVTKGSGGNGINTVYQVGAAGTLPTAADGLNAPVTILPGFPTTLAKTDSSFFPFGIWFANSTTLYVADEGDGVAAHAATDAFAGLEKWSLTNGVWHLAYTLQTGLGLGQSYGVDGYPTSLNPATDGLRNITGIVNDDGTVTVFGLTSTVSANGDQGADPNRLVSITDLVSAAALPSGEAFSTLETANYGEVLRGVSFGPGVPEPSSWAMLIAGFGIVGAAARRRRIGADDLASVSPIVRHRCHTINISSLLRSARPHALTSGSNPRSAVVCVAQDLHDSCNR